MRPILARLAASAAAIACSQPGRAQDAPVPPAEPAIVVTASRTGEAGGIETVDARTIEQRQSASLLDVLADLPGVRAAPLSGPAGPSLVSIRGGEGNFTAILLDGIRLNDPTNSEGGAFDFALIDPALVERIEVARTATSAIHGADALSGVVQIVTRPPGREGIALGGSAWADSRYGASATGSASVGWRSGGLTGAGGHYDSGDGDPAGQVRRSQALLRGRQDVGSFRLDAIGLYAKTRGTAFPQDSGGPLLAVNRALERREGDMALAGLTLTRDPAARLRPRLAISYGLQHHDTDSPAIAPGVLDGVPATRAATRLARTEASAALAADLGPATLAAGGAFLREDGRSDGALDFGFPLPVRFALVRETHSGFAEATVRAAADLTASGAVRYDRLRGDGGHWTARGALSWAVAPEGPTLFARAANGYKPPSLYALGHPLIGNPGLAAETGRSLEAGIEWPLRAGRITLTLFDNRFRNLVDFDAASFRLVNRARVGARGAEMAARVSIARHWHATAALTHVALDSAVPLRWRPEWTGNARLSWQSRNWEVTAALRANSDVADSAIPTGARTTPGRAEADVGAQYRVQEHVAVRLSVLNLGNNRSWDAIGTPQPGRSLRIAIVAR